ncbi:MAG: hypothetical protein K2O24_04760 [Muribaculaceae bacterium]|nr:hypothetical protein [Muribaculaceae bacterium]
MIDFFDKMRSWGGRRNPLLQKLKVYGVWNTFVTWSANTILPMYFKATAGKKENSLKGVPVEKGVMISLTSFGPRLEKLWLVIEGLLRQKTKPEKIVLYLTASQVPDIEKLPQSLLKQRERGLEIVLCPDNIRSHTKYYYAMTQNPDKTVITVDDDLFYRSDLVTELLKSSREYPGAICANWVKEIIPGEEKYANWPDGHKRELKKNFLLLGVSGVLYPPHALHEDAFDVGNIIDLCLTADDVWLSCMAIRKGTPILYTAYKYNHLPVMIPNNETLISVNMERNQVQVDNLNRHFLAATGKRPFVDLA